MEPFTFQPLIHGAYPWAPYVRKIGKRVGGELGAVNLVIHIDQLINIGDAKITKDSAHLFVAHFTYLGRIAHGIRNIWAKDMHELKRSSMGGAFSK